ncbi:BatD family protein [Thiohalocapsa marina]|nr:BatD family protein [Thiohalocapsa marina]
MYPLLLSLLIPAGVHAQHTVSAELSAQRIAVGQPVTLLLRQTGPEDASVPDLVPLQQDFRILSRASSQTVEEINGKRRTERTLRLMLLPLNSGTLQLPAIRIGQQRTAPLTLVVSEVAADASPDPTAPPAPLGTSVSSQGGTPAPLDEKAPPTATAQTTMPGALDRAAADTAPSPAVTLSARIVPEQVRLGAQAVLEVRIRAEDGAATGRLLPPAIAGARVLPLGDERRLEQTADGPIWIHEHRFSVFPSESGSLDIPALRFDHWTAATDGPRPVRSAPLRLVVAPIPDGIAADDWRPARGFSLSEAGPSEVRVAPGQPLERLITVRADGLMAEDIPPIPLAIPFQLRRQDEPPRLWNERTPDGVIGYRSERIRITAPEPGVFTLKGPIIDWWDTQQQRPARATLPDVTLTVAAYRSSTAPPVPSWEDGAGHTAAERPSGAGSTGDPEPALEQAPGEAPDRWYWLWLPAAVSVLVLAIIGGWWQRRQRLRQDQASPLMAGAADDDGRMADTATRTAAKIAPAAGSAPSAGITEAIAAVERAYASGEAGAARTALLTWAAEVWPRQVPGNLAQLALRVEPPLRDHIHLLEKAFFSPTPLDWRQPGIGALLASAAQRIDA